MVLVIKIKTKNSVDCGTSGMVMHLFWTFDLIKNPVLIYISIIYLLIYPVLINGITSDPRTSDDPCTNLSWFAISKIIFFYRFFNLKTYFIFDTK